MALAYWLYGERTQQRDSDLCSPWCQTFQCTPTPYIPLASFKLPPQCWSSEGASLSGQVHMWFPQEELLRAPTASSTDSISTGVCSQKLWGLIFQALESWAGGPGVGLGLLVPEISLSNCYPHESAHSLSAHLPPFWMDVGSTIPSCQIL